jgi:hypothetical protein
VEQRCALRSVLYDPNEYLEETRARLRRDGNEVADIRLTTGPVIIGSRAKFRLRWMATKVNLLRSSPMPPEPRPRGLRD